MRFETDRTLDVGGEPSLAEMTEKAIQMMQRNQKGFFLLVEGGRIGIIKEFFTNLLKFSLVLSNKAADKVGICFEFKCKEKSKNLQKINH